MCVVQEKKNNCGHVIRAIALDRGANPDYNLLVRQNKSTLFDQPFMSTCLIFLSFNWIRSKYILDFMMVLSCFEFCLDFDWKSFK